MIQRHFYNFSSCVGQIVVVIETKTAKMKHDKALKFESREVKALKKKN